MTITSLDDELTRQLMHQRIVVLGQALEEDNANRLMHQLLLLSAEDKRTDISLWINSPGGSVSAMLAIYDDRCSSCAITALATPSSISVPR